MAEEKEVVQTTNQEQEEEKEQVIGDSQLSENTNDDNNENENENENAETEEIDNEEVADSPEAKEMLAAIAEDEKTEQPPTPMTLSAKEAAYCRYHIMPGDQLYGFKTMEDYRIFRVKGKFTPYLGNDGKPFKSIQNFKYFVPLVKRKPTQNWPEPPGYNFGFPKRYRNCAGCDGRMEDFTNYWAIPQNPLTGFWTLFKNRIWPLCRFCTRAYYLWLKEHYLGDESKAMMHLCMNMDIYYDGELVNSLLNQKPVYWLAPMPDRYLIAVLGTNADYIKEEFVGKSFIEQIIDYKDQIGAHVKMKSVPIGTDPIIAQLTDETLSYRRSVMATFGRDPFVTEQDVEKRSAAYRSLALMIDETMAGDLPRQEAALQVVSNFQKINNFKAIMADLWKEYESSREGKLEDAYRPYYEKIVAADIFTKAEIKIVEQIFKTKYPQGIFEQYSALNKESSDQARIISTFCKDNGFTEKYSSSQKKGSGAISDVLKEMNEYQYDAGITNFYDIQTSEALQHIAKISGQAIVEELNLKENDYAKIIEEQREELMKTKAETARVKEEMRLLKASLNKEHLLESLRQAYVKRGFPEEEINEILINEENKEIV